MTAPATDAQSPEASPTPGLAISLERRGAAARPGLELPVGCVVCGKPAGRALPVPGDSIGRSLWSGAKPGLLAPHCQSCERDRARRRSEGLALALSGVVLGVTALLTAPLLAANSTRSNLAGADWSWVFVYLPLGLAPLLVWLPWGVWRVLGRLAPEPVALRDQRLYVAHTAWGTRLAALNGLKARPAFPIRRRPWTVFLLSVGCLVATMATFDWHRSSLLVLNFGDVEQQLYLNGKLVARIEPAAGESVHAGARLNVAAGQQTVRVTSRNAETIETTLELAPGEQHLYAPAATSRCFWLETMSYGRQSTSASPDPQISSLRGSQRFWRLPAKIDAWFVAPPSSRPDGVSTGGQMTALRHAPCELAPPAAR